ncbi:MAG: tyrosine-type recombinase/integrase [Bacteriovoracaceae bacterium]
MNNTQLSSSELSLVTLESEFLEQLKTKGKSPNTIKNYKTDLDCFKDFLLKKQEGLMLNDFGIPKVMEYGSYLDKKYTSDNSRRRRVQTVRIFFDYLITKNLFSDNPMRKLPTSPKFLDVPHPTPYKDVRVLWDYLSTESNQGSDIEKMIALRNKVIIALIYGAGLKVSDLAKLSRKQILITENEIRVLVTPLKRDPYTVPVPSIFFGLFNEYMERLTAECNKSKMEFDELLFNANPYRILSGGLSPRGLEIVFEELRKKLVITLTPKSLRQSCILKWLQQKQDDTNIKEWMGVTPSYSLKTYQDVMYDNLFSEIN